jgi:hypothetical protein
VAIGYLLGQGASGIMDRPKFATNIFDEYIEETEPIRSHEEIMKHNWFWFRVAVIIFLIAVLIDTILINVEGFG